VRSFASRITRWQSRHGRHDLPWQGRRDSYRIWISEIMLQQTQVATVIPYYERFIARFPDVHSLAAASDDEVMSLWSGLGYYARARNVLAAARRVATSGGEFPGTFDALVELPGIGRSTAAAIAAFATGERRAILDGNVRRVLARHAGVDGDPANAKVVERFWEVADSRLPRSAIEPYTQGLMDLGATVCTARKPACRACPVAVDCVARTEDRVDELPGKRRRAKRARKRIAMLIVTDRGEVLVEKRPPKGIWGGLWSLPECAEGDVPKGAERLEPFTHTFTHFTLAVTPWRIHGRRAAAEKPNTLWLPFAQVEGAALPSPVKKLLRSLSPTLSHAKTFAGARGRGGSKRSASAASGTGAAPRGASTRRSARGASASRRS
jgi:A/G-specific adenine glycosylase